MPEKDTNPSSNKPVFKGKTTRIVLDVDMEHAEKPSAEPGGGEEAQTIKKNIKKETSRIKLEDVDAGFDKAEQMLPVSSIAETEAEIQPIPKTIKLQRPGVPLPLEEIREKESVPASEAPTFIQSAASKGETSRIVLDEAIEHSKKEMPEVTGIPVSPTPLPKTIKLKRPPTTVLETTEAATAKKTETTKIELREGAIAPLPPSERRTVKIRRTERNIAPQTVGVARPAEKLSEQPSPVSAPEQLAEEISTLSSVVLVAAVLLVAGLVYIMLSQLLSPAIHLPLPAQLL